MPQCNVCGERYYYSSEVDPPEPCMCGEEFGYDLWVDSGSWREWVRLKTLQYRWRLAKVVWKLSEWVTPK